MEGIKCPRCNQQTSSEFNCGVTLLVCIGYYNEKDEWVERLCNNMTCRYICSNNHTTTIQWPHK